MLSRTDVGEELEKRLRLTVWREPHELSIDNDNQYHLT
jgi:hypothetical protein